MCHLASYPPEKYTENLWVTAAAQMVLNVHAYQMSLPSLLYVVGGDDNGGLVHSYLKEMVPDPGEG